MNAPYQIEDVVHEGPTHWALRVPKGYEVYRIGTVCSTRVAQIGWQGDKGLAKAITECQRREKKA